MVLSLDALRAVDRGGGMDYAPQIGSKPAFN